MLVKSKIVSHKRRIGQKYNTRKSQEVKYACGCCNFRSRWKASVSSHQKVKHKDDQKRIIGIGCKSCEEGELHMYCKFPKSVKQNDIKSRHLGKKGKVKEKSLTCSNCYSKEEHSICDRWIERGATRMKSLLSPIETVKTDNKKVNNVRKNAIRSIIIKCNDTNCGYTSTKKGYITTHERINHSKEASQKYIILKCKHCEFENNRNMVLERHVRSQHNKEVRFSCSNCMCRSFFKQSIEFHVESHPKSDNAKLLLVGCIQCKENSDHKICETEAGRQRIRKEGTGMTQKDLDPLVIHKRVTKDNQKQLIPSKKCIQTECDYKSTKQVYIKTHERLNHGNPAINKEDIIKCTECEFQNNIYQIMERHKKSQHNKEVNFICSHCVFQSFFKHSIVSHIKNHHKNINAKVLLIGCIKCKKDTAHTKCEAETNIDDKLFTNGELTKIKTKKNAKYNYNCKICLFVGLSHKQIISHMKTEHDNEKLYQCDFCKYKCNYVPNLKTHRQAKHSGIKYECDICKWKTAWKPPFFEHKRVVHGIFQNKSKYRSDLELAEDLCDICGFAANSKRSMRLHKASSCEVKSNLTGLLHRGHRINPGKQGKSLANSEGPCRKCEKLASNPKALVQHEEVVHNRRYRDCMECGFLASSILHLNTHKYESHNLDKPHVLHVALNGKTQLIK